MANGHAPASCLVLLLLTGSPHAAHGAEQPKSPTSIVALIAQPESYDGKDVLVTGFCSLAFEGTAVYLHEEDYRKLLTANSIWLETKPATSKSPTPVHEHYCLVAGTFRAEPARNGRRGRLEHLTRLEVLPTRADVEQKVQ